MGEEKKTKCSALTIVLVLIIVALLGYIAYTNIIAPKNRTKSIGSQSLLVLDELTFKEFEKDETGAFILKVQNTSSNTYNNVTPVLIYTDVNGMPIHEGWGARIFYWAPGETRCIRFYDITEDYAEVKVGLFKNENGIEYKDLRDQITYNVEKATEPDEDGEIRLTFTGENKSDKDIEVEFQIAYYSEDKLIYESQFMDIIEGNSKLDTYEYYATKYYDGTAFPEGYTYEVTLVEAVEYVDEDIEYVDYEDDIDVPDLTVEDKIEHAIFQLLKKNYGDDMDSAKIYVDKTYTAEEAKKIEGLKEIELGENDVSFEVSMHIQPAEGAKVMQFTIPDGEYDEETGWVSGISRLGVLRDKGNGEYEITDYGTGW